jgi:hypothetical protein
MEERSDVSTIERPAWRGCGSAGTRVGLERASPCCAGLPSGWAQRARLPEDGDFGVDRIYAEGARNGYAVVSVAHVVVLAEPHYRDWWERRAAASGDPDALPAAPARAGWSEGAVKGSRLGGLHGPDDRIDGDDPQAGHAPVGGGGDSQRLLERRQTCRCAGPPQEPGHNPLSAASAARTGERRLSVDHEAARLHGLAEAVPRRPLGRGRDRLHDVDQQSAGVGTNEWHCRVRVHRARSGATNRGC